MRGYAKEGGGFDKGGAKGKKFGICSQQKLDARGTFLENLLRFEIF
jgi:hypothetical protein